MKIAMTHVDLPNEARGGVAFQAHYLANALVERGHDVTMFTFSPFFDECRYRIHQYPIPPGLRRFKTFLLAGQLARTDFSKFDLIHTHGDNYLLGRQHPQVRTFHGSARDEAQTAKTWRRRIYQTLMISLEAAGARVADQSIGVSASTRRRIPAITGVIPCGVDLRQFRPGSKSPHPTVLFVGTTGGRKRGAWLAEIFEREIRPRFPDAELWSVAEKPMEGDGVVNFGKVCLEDLADLYRRAWVFCLPSTYEGFGVPYVEALASGTAVVATPNPGAREVLQDGEFGLLAEDDQLAEQIGTLLADADRRAALTGIGLTRAQVFSWEQIAQQYEQVYQTLMVPSELYVHAQ